MTLGILRPANMGRVTGTKTPKGMRGMREKGTIETGTIGTRRRTRKTRSTRTKRNIISLPRLIKVTGQARRWAIRGAIKTRNIRSTTRSTDGKNPKRLWPPSLHRSGER